LIPGDDRKVIREPSRDDRRAHPDLPGEACIEGRMIVAPPENSTEILYLFTTLEETAEQTVLLYARPI
jgi:hypothetical protein